MKKDLTTGHPLKLIIYFTIPLLIGNLFQQLYNTADTIIVGRTVSFDALAAVGLTAPLVFFIIGFAQGVTAGFSIITAQRFGAKDYDGVRRSVAASTILSILTTIVLTIPSVLLSRILLIIINTPDKLLEDAYIYIVIIFWGTFAAIFFNMFSNLLRAVGNSKVPLYFLIIASIVNIVLDLVFILYFKMGVAGAALATVIAQIIPCLLSIEYIRRYLPELKTKKSDWKITFNEIMEHIRIGLPMGFQVSIIAIGMVILQWALNKLGPVAIGAFTVATRIDVLAVQCLLSFGITMATFTAQNYGARNIKRVKDGMKYGAITSVGFGLLAGVIIILFAEFSIKLFLGKDMTDPALIAETIRLGKIYLWINCSLYVFLALLLVYRNVLQGLGNSMIPTIAGIMELLMRAVAAIILPIYIGFTGISLAHPVAWIGGLVPVAIAYHVIIKKLEKEYKTINNVNTDIV